MTPTTVRRYHWLDVARGVALVAMALYHFCWNLELFGYLEPGSAGSGGLKLFARSIASSFLILVGISLALAHTNGIRWPSFWQRWAKIVGAALIITIATYFATPGAYIYFGILHHIALASLLGLAFLRAPSWLLLGTIIAIFGISYAVALPAFDTRLLAWTGLYNLAPRSNDFVPVLPWFSAVITGMVLGRLILLYGHKIGDINSSIITRPLTFIGRRSLMFYLLHQPVLIAIVYTLALIIPPTSQSANITSEVFGACIATCSETNTGAFCARYCDCAIDAMAIGDILVVTEQNQSRIYGEMAQIANQCAQTTLENQ